MRAMMRLAERLGGMTLEELAERMGDEEFGLWIADGVLRDEERRDVALEARAKAKVGRG